MEGTEGTSGEAGTGPASTQPPSGSPDAGSRVALDAAASRTLDPRAGLSDPGTGRRRSRAQMVVLGLLVLALAGVLAVGGGLWWAQGKLNPSGPKDPVAFTVPAGASTADIVGSLADAGVVADATVFTWFLRLRGHDPFEAGTYEGLTTNQPMSEVLDVLAAGPLPPETDRVTIPEGLWLTEIRDRVLNTFPDMTAAGWDEAMATVRSRYQPEGATLEGLLFPATYEVASADRGDATKLVAQMVATFDAVADELGLADATARLASDAGGRQLTPYEVVTIASMVEAETRIPAERPQVARVILNRIRDGMSLGIDATVIYALGERREVLTFDDLDIDSPWNTRRFVGIPPSPIGSPGRESLEAALNPAPGNWLYYVLVDPDGTHFFTDNYDEFLAAAEDARQRGVFQ